MTGRWSKKGVWALVSANCRGISAWAYVITISSHDCRIDDIQDNSILRRGIPVAHSIYGVASTINAANYVMIIALEKSLELGHPLVSYFFTKQSIINPEKTNLLYVAGGRPLNTWWLSLVFKNRRVLVFGRKTFQKKNCNFQVPKPYFWLNASCIRRLLLLFKIMYCNCIRKGLLSVSILKDLH